MHIKPDSIQFKHLNLGSIKLAISASCSEMNYFKGAYFHASDLYMVQDDRIEIEVDNEKLNIGKSLYLNNQHIPNEVLWTD